MIPRGLTVADELWFESLPHTQRIAAARYVISRLRVSLLPRRVSPTGSSEAAFAERINESLDNAIRTHTTQTFPHDFTRDP